MAFASARLDRTLLARLPFGEDWGGLEDPSGAGAGAGVCDPFDVRVRMAMYRLLVEHGNRRGAFGAQDALNPYWGYASQLAWQHRSGRLAGTQAVAETHTHAIDPESWWGACNEALSVVPYLGAMQVGIVPRLRLEVAPEYGRALSLWRGVARAMSELRPGDDLEPVRIAIWGAHLESIETAVRLHERAYEVMPREERRFARGWVRMVELFGAAAVRTDLERIAPFGGGALPPRVLGDEVDLAELTRHERSTVRGVFAMADRPAWRWALEMRAWRRMMRSRAARDEAEVLLAGILGRGPDVRGARRRAVVYTLRPSLGAWSPLRFFGRPPDSRER